MNDSFTYSIMKKNVFLKPTKDYLEKIFTYLLLKHFFIVQTRAVQYVITSGRPKIPV